jgi:hypothetical protein
VYAARYAFFGRSLAFVAQGGAGGAGGCVVAVLDGRAFGRRRGRGWWPALRAGYPELSRDLAEGLSARERFALRVIHHRRGAPGELAAGSRPGLGVNLVPRLPGRGIGRRLIAAVVCALRDQGSGGVHLRVGYGSQRAAGFGRPAGGGYSSGDGLRAAVS